MSNINVYVRLRPPNESEKRQSVPQERLQTDSNLRQIKVYNQTNDRVKSFKFSRVFTTSSSQNDVFTESEASKLVDKVLEGYHSTIFAYGQTGSGKTYTMQGFEYDLNDGNPRLQANLQQSNQRLGVIPRCLRYLFSQIEEKSQAQNRTYLATLSYLQIYNERIYDLLDFSNRDKGQNGLKLRWNKYDQFTVERLEEVTCHDAQEALTYYVRGARNKVMARHKMNMNSSRSHTILTIRVQSYDNQDPRNVISSKLELVDLAGSEKQSITGSVGRVFKEGIEINKSLFTLRQVIASLFECSNNRNGSQDVHIPYRDSKLTSILKQSIGGNNYCTMLACINYGDIYIDETIQTLTYASFASHIANMPVRNEDPNVQEIRKLKQQLADVTEQLNRANEHIKLLSDLANKRIESGSTANLQNEAHLSAIIQKPVASIKQTKDLSLQYGSGGPEKVAVAKQQTPAQKNKSTSLGASLKPRQFIESITMIKELLQSNILLRDNVENLNQNIAKKDAEFYQVMKENQLLRERWEMVGGIILDQEEAMKDTVERQNITEYERLIGERESQQPYLRRLNTSSFRPASLEPKRPATNKPLNLSYNQLLQQHSKRKTAVFRKRNLI